MVRPALEMRPFPSPWIPPWLSVLHETLSCLMHQMKGSVRLQPKNVRLVRTLFNTPVMWFMFISNVLATIGLAQWVKNAALCLYDVRFSYGHCSVCFREVSELRIGWGEINVSVEGDNELAESWTWCAWVVSCHCVSMLPHVLANNTMKCTNLH